MVKIPNIKSVTFTFQNYQVWVKINWINLVDSKAKKTFEKLMRDNGLQDVSACDEGYDYFILNKDCREEDIEYINRIFQNLKYTVKSDGNTITFS